MGKPKEQPKVALPQPDEVPLAKPLVEKIARAKARLAKVREQLAQGGQATRADPRHRAARKRVKRAQRRLRERLQYAATRRPKAEGTQAAAAPPAS
jgi:hypothetical protein